MCSNSLIWNEAVAAPMLDRPSTKHPLGALVAEGKTKKIHLGKSGSDLVTVISKDDITAGDGAKHDIIPDKGRLATATTCNVFRLLKSCGLPVAFLEQDSAISFVAPKCDMLPYEVVVRREAHGSYLKRNPHLAKGQLFPQLLVEFYLKTKDKNWKGKPLVADDPLMGYADGDKQIQLFNPAKPLVGQEPFLVASSLRAIIGQALIRVSCTACREVYTPSAETIERAGLPAESSHGTFLRGAGCAQCGQTGFRGRVGVYELMEVTPAIARLIMKRANSQDLLEAAMAEGMTTMRQDGVAKAMRGLTTLEEVVQLT